MYTFLPEGRKRLWIAAVHAVIWVVYVGFMLAANKLSNPGITVIHAVLFMFPFCLVFYISLFWLNRYRKLGVLLSLVTFIGTFLALSLVAYIYMYRALPLANIQLYSNDQIREFVKYAVLGYIQYYAYAALYFIVHSFFRKERVLRKMQEDKYINELENARLKEQELKSQKEKLQAEYAFLRAQVNPHFLHNTLNTLYSQAQEYSETLASNISRLSNMMRYSFESIEYETDSVPVEKELRNLRRLIEMNNIRRNAVEIVDFSVDGEIQDQMVPPLSFITIVENAFKYGDLTNPDHPLVIRLILMPGYLRFYCRNKIMKKSLHDTSHNIGILNLKKRLQVLYNDKHTIIANSANGFYTIELTIKT